MRALLLLLTLLPTAAMAAEVYRWVDGDGVVHFADEPRTGGDAGRVELREVNTAKSVSVGPAGDDAAAGRVVLYSTAWCGYCDRARAWLRRGGVDFEEYDVETSRRGQRYRERSGIDSVPILVVGDRRMVGFTPARFEALHAP